MIYQIRWVATDGTSATWQEVDEAEYANRVAKGWVGRILYTQEELWDAIEDQHE